MNGWWLKVLLPILLLAFIAGTADAQSDSKKKTYRWVDKNGQVHYGDSVPAEYADAVIDNTLSLLATVTTVDDLTAIWEA